MLRATCHSADNLPLKGKKTKTKPIRACPKMEQGNFSFLSTATNAVIPYSILIDCFVLTGYVHSWKQLSWDVLRTIPDTCWLTIHPSMKFQPYTQTWQQLWAFSFNTSGHPWPQHFSGSFNRSVSQYYGTWEKRESILPALSAGEWYNKNLRWTKGKGKLLHTPEHVHFPS